MAKATTIFVEYKEELLPKLIPAVIDPIWYPPKDEEEDTNEDDDSADDEDQG